MLIRRHCLNALLIACFGLIAATPAHAETLVPNAVLVTNSPGYVSPTFGYSLTWDPWWTIDSASSHRGVDTLVLRGGLAHVAITGRVAFDGRPASCLSDAVTDLANESGILRLRPLLDEWGVAVEAAEPARISATYVFDQEILDGSVVTAIAFVECRVLEPDAAVLAIRVVSRADAFALEAPMADLLLDRLTMPNVLGRNAVPSAAAG